MPLDLKAVRQEIEAGLPNETRRLEEAGFNREFADGNFDRFRPRAPDGYEPFRYLRTSRFMSWVCDALTRNLYREGPKRQLPDHPEAQEWLEGLYRYLHMDSAWQEADRMTVWGGFSAFQIAGTADPDYPLRYFLWGADELVVWLDDEDPACAAAVATIDRYDNRRRLRVWTEETVEEWQTEKWNGETTGRTAFKLVRREVNPYGVIPFAFVHFRPPTARFETSGPGHGLRTVNDWLNFTYTETSDSVRYGGRPILTAYNVRAGWRPPSIRPGVVMDVTSAAIDAGGNGPEPRLEWLQADSTFVGATWEDVDNFLGHTLETHGIPRAAFRMEQAHARSGISIVAEQLPLLDWAQSRQRPFARYEACLAQLVLHCGSQHLYNNGINRGDLANAAADPGLVLRWGRMWANLPGPERDASDQFRLDMGLCSRIDLLMERDGLTREEAEQRIAEIAADRKLEADLLGVITPEGAAEAMKKEEAQEGPEQEEDEQETDESENEE